MPTMHRRADDVGDAFERDRGGGFARIDAVGEQHDLQRLAGDAAQREIAERLGGETHAREPRETDTVRGCGKHHAQAHVRARCHRPLKSSAKGNATPRVRMVPAASRKLT